jgi:single-strand DNA-binding protein
MFHNVTILGNLGTDPDMRYIPSGTAVCSFNVATNRKYTNSDGTLVEETVWFKITTWGKQAEAVADYLHKGDPVFIEGRLKPDESGNPNIWTRQDGTAAANFEVTANTVKFINGGKRAQNAAVNQAQSPVQVPAQAPKQVSQTVDEIEV